MFILLSFLACEDKSEYEPSPLVVEKENTRLFVDDSTGVSREDEAMKGTENGRRAFLCDAKDRLEFDIYDINPEFTNPKDYQIILQKEGRVVRKSTFSQYCTLNNTAIFYNLPKGKYQYRITSDCTRRIIEGSINYLGGYQAHIMYIDQSLCD